MHSARDLLSTRWPALDVEARRGRLQDSLQLSPGALADATAPALSKLGGPEFRRWQERVDQVLAASQRQESGADEEGSWDPVDEWGPAGGRVYSTALAVMTLAIAPAE